MATPISSTPSTPIRPSSRATSAPEGAPKTPPRRVAQAAQKAFISPEGTSHRPRCAIPPTPMRRRAPRGPKEPSFPGAKLPIQSSPALQAIPSRLFSTGTVYMDGETPRNVIQQPPRSKSCWAYSFAMLLTDVIRSGKEITLDAPFEKWFTDAYLLNADEVQGEAQRLGIPLTLTNIPQEDPLNTIKRQIEISGFPVLVTVEHPIYSGHATVIDKISDTHTTVRDPADGKVFVVLNEKMQSYFKDQEEDEVPSEEKQKCLSVTPQAAASL